MEHPKLKKAKNFWHLIQVSWPSASNDNFSKPSHSKDKQNIGNRERTEHTFHFDTWGTFAPGSSESLHTSKMMLNAIISSLQKGLAVQGF